MTPPRVFYRVEWFAGYGWPECERQEQTARNFTSMDAAAIQLAAIRALPSHHALIGCWRGRVEWEPLPISELEEHLDDRDIVDPPGADRPPGRPWRPRPA